MDLPEHIGWPVALIAAAGTAFGAVGAAVLAYLGKRRETEASAPAAQTSADADLVNASGELAKQFGEAAVALLQPVRAELESLRSRLDSASERHAADLAETRDANAKAVADLRGDLERCHDAHIACEQKYAELEQRILRAALDEPAPAYLPGFDPKSPR